MLPVIARICSYENEDLDSKNMGCWPIYPTQKEFGQGNLTVANIDLIESNEAFSTQSCAVGKTLDLNTNIVTVNGGEIALDHPIGASGYRILVTLIY